MVLLGDFALAVACLEVPRISWPLKLNVNFGMDKRITDTGICLRCIVDPDHASLAMINLTKVVPNRRRVIDDHSEDGVL